MNIKTMRRFIEIINGLKVGSVIQYKDRYGDLAYDRIEQINEDDPNEAVMVRSKIWGLRESEILTIEIVNQDEGEEQ